MILSCYGALDRITLAPGGSVVVDAGHMVAYEETVASVLRRVAGNIQSLKTGEGLVFEFTGPGEVWTQSRNPSWLIEWISQSVASRA